MSLTFDYVTMPPKSQEISQIQTNEINRMHQGNEQLASQFQNQVKQSSEKTIRKENADNRELKNDDEQKRRQQKKRQNKKNSSDDKEEDKPKHFDMKI